MPPPAHAPTPALGLVPPILPRRLSTAAADAPATAPASHTADTAADPERALDDFEPFYRAHVGRVYALCLRMAGDRGRAEELTQDVFVRAGEKRAGFRGASLVSTWLHRLAVNVVLNAARAERRRMARVQPAEAPDELPGAMAGAREPQVGERLDLERAIAMLPPGARAAFVLHDVEGYRCEEIARLTGITPATVRSQLHRARGLLMEALDR